MARLQGLHETRWYPSNYDVLYVELVHVHDGELLGTLCDKRHDAVVVMDNKYFITLVSVHITVIALMSCIFAHVHSYYNRDIAR